MFRVRNQPSTGGSYVNHCTPTAASPPLCAINWHRSTCSSLRPDACRPWTISVSIRWMRAMIDFSYLPSIIEIIFDTERARFSFIKISVGNLNRFTLSSVSDDELFLFHFFLSSFFCSFWRMERLLNMFF